jgi:hypothetical protein
VDHADDLARRERATRRRAAMTVTLVRPGLPEEPGPFGLEAMALACQLTRAAYAVARIDGRSVPRRSMAVALRPLLS